MAYGVKYRADWQSPMRDKRAYRIEILEDGYTGDVSPLYPTGDVLTITRGNIDDDEFEPIRGSEAKLSLLCKDDGDPYLSLFTTSATKYKLIISTEVADMWSTYWEGYLATSSYSQPLALPPYKVSLSAVDGLALLNNMPFRDDNGEMYSGTMTLGEIIHSILRKVSPMGIMYGPMDNVTPSDGGAMTALSLDAQSIYSALGEDVSSYDVLAAILRTLRLAVHQTWGSWSIRSIASLNVESRAVMGKYVNNGGVPIPLYSDNGDAHGVSTSATLSLLPAYASLKVSRPDAQEKRANTLSMLDPMRWRRINGDNYGFYAKAVYGGIRMSASTVKGGYNMYMGGYYVMDGTITPGGNVTMSFQASILSLSEGERSIGIGLWLTDASIADIRKLLESGEATGKNTWRAWDNEAKSWGGIDADDHTINSIQLASSRYQPIEIPCSPSSLTATDVTITTAGLPTISRVGKPCRVVVLIAGPDGGSPLPPIEMRDPQISFEQGDTQIVDADDDDIVISESGLGAITYNQAFADSLVDVGGGVAYDAPLIVTDTGTTLQGLITPTMRPLLIDAAERDIKMLRNRPIRQIDGEVDSGFVVDLDALWVDREGRKYYTNYISHKLRRGIDLVQLRELPNTISPGAPKGVVKGSPLGGVVGLDTCAYIATVSSRTIVRYDVATDTTTPVLSSVSGTYEVTLNEGIGCASMITYNGTYYTIYAYDTHGTLLSRIDKVNSIGRFGSQYNAVMCRSARFDATTKMWTLLGGDSTALRIWRLDANGREIDWTLITLSQYTSPADFRLIPNGFFYRSKPITMSAYVGYVKSDITNVSGSGTTFGANKMILAATHKLLVVRDDQANNVQLYRRSSSLVGIGEVSLASYSVTAEVVGINNAIAVMRDPSTKEIYASDLRNADNIIIPTSNTITQCSPIWLSGDTIYGLYAVGSSTYAVMSYKFPLK